MVTPIAGSRPMHRVNHRPSSAHGPSRRRVAKTAISPRGFALLDAILGGLLLAMALAAVLSLAARSLQMERRGENEVVAAALLDELLSMVLVEGPAEYPKRHDLAGRFDPPFDAWEYELQIEAQGLGDPWRVVALVRDPVGSVHRCGTLIAPRLDEVPEPARRPPKRIDREERIEQNRRTLR